MSPFEHGASIGGIDGIVSRGVCVIFSWDFCWKDGDEKFYIS